ncbi:MAG: tRNA (adenosine(37)-N6)-dimethylallyltransferase MiaA [Candidatus Magasanikbacteria bacterium]|nr:tRNA (adenosine(37)-N6)-dimethylallyltransferase MiaA [Candidatus Magasanikbacteria bacterium]
MEKLPKLVVIVGPTASAKTDLAIALAKKYNGEIVSADSRQIYRELSIGTAKPAGEWVEDKYLVAGVPYHLVDCVDPTTSYTLADFKRDALAAIQDIICRGKVPFLVGGTGLYIAAIVDNLDIPDVPPDADLRQSFEKLSLTELQKLIKERDPVTAAVIDRQNPRRLIRALEVATLSGESFRAQQTKSPALFQTLQIGLAWPKDILEARIEKRLKIQIEQGFVEEVQALWKKYGSAVVPSLTSIGYQPFVSYLSGEMNLPETLRLVWYQTRQYAKRQMTWFKRDSRIHWIAGADQSTADDLVKFFLA